MFCQSAFLSFCFLICFKSSSHRYGSLQMQHNAKELSSFISGPPLAKVHPLRHLHKVTGLSEILQKSTPSVMLVFFGVKVFMLQ